MLQRIKRGQRTSTTDILEYLCLQGFETTQRTIQRDLVELAKVFPGLKSDGARPAGWYWEKDARINDIPGLNASMALSFKLVESFLKPLLPPLVTENIAPYFDGADRVLNDLDNQHFGDWNKRVRILPRTQILLPAQADPMLVETVYESLFSNQRFTARYKPRYQDEAQYEFNPLALVFRESVIYLVATLWDYEDPRHFSLHRFNWIESLDKPATIISGFDLDEYLRSGAFDYPIEPESNIRLQVRFLREAAEHLYETPLSKDQTIVSDADNEWVLVKAEVKDTLQLRWWLLGFGDQVEVLAPKKLRVEMMQICRNMAESYGTNDEQL